jgi:type IV secretion system protein TrbE
MIRPSLLLPKYGESDMFRLSTARKEHAESGCLNDRINLFGFVDDHTFLTKSGDVGVVLSVHGVDYECVTQAERDQFTKRLESAFKIFDEHCRIYQYLFKRNHAAVPHRLYKNPVVNAAIESRVSHLKSKAESLYSLEIYYVIVLEGQAAKTMLSRALSSGKSSLTSLSKHVPALLATKKQVLLLGEEIDRLQALIRQKASSFVLQVNDFLQVDLLSKDDAFRVLRRLVNFDPQKLELSRLKHDTFLDYYLCESHLECHRGYLRLDDYYVKVLTLREPSAQSFPLMFQKLLEVEADFYVTVEWKKEEPDKTRGRIHSRRRHFHNTKRSLVSYFNTSDAAPSPQEILIDDSKEAQVHELGEALKALEVTGHYFGELSLTVVIYDLDLSKVDTACSEFYKVFSVHDAQLYNERYNLLNAYLATVPGNRAFNLRRLYITNANHADYSFLFTLHTGERENHHLQAEYLAVLETNHKTPYFLNLHHHDVAHSVVLGRTGSGKSFLLNFLITNLQKYDPYTFIFDLGGSFGSLTRLFGGTYVHAGIESHDFKINPFSLPRCKRNLDFLTLFLKVLVESQGADALGAGQEREFYEQIQNLYEIEETALHTLSTLGNTLRRDLDSRLFRWKQGGQFGFLFDNVEDTVSFSRFQCFDFQNMREYRQVLEPLLFYILHRADEIIRDPKLSQSFKAFFIDEAWVFLKNPSIRSYIVEALKTWRKHNAALVLSTQSLDELRKSDILDIILESCVTKIFLANPDMDRDLYQRQFHLNNHEIDLITGLIPKQQMLIKTPDASKVANLSVDPKSYWLYTNDPFDNRKRDEAFALHGFEKGLELLAAQRAEESRNGIRRQI